MRTSFVLLMTLTSVASIAQQRLGINTPAPVRTIDVYGVEDQFARITSSSIGGTAGIEWVRGPVAGAEADWRLLNAGGQLRLESSADNFATGGLEALRIDLAGQTGIGTSSPASLLHVDGGTQLAFGDAGYAILGSTDGLHLALDNQALQAEGFGPPPPLHIQSNGGTTTIGQGGGNIYMGQGAGKVSVGPGSVNAKLNVDNASIFNLFVQNADDLTNTWYIGATASDWVTGGQQLVFSPTGSSGDAVFRLHDQTENDGDLAPVMISTSAAHTILIDGNEIDTRATPLYINYNSEEDTYFNPSGGRVGIGTDNPQARLHVRSTSSPLRLENGSTQWSLAVEQVGSEDLYFTIDNLALAHIDGLTGQWIHASDRNLKSDLRPLENVSARLDSLGVYRYRMRSDPDGKVHAGILAQEALPCFPELVHEHDGQYGVDYGQLAVIGLQALQEQQRLIDILREKIEAIKQLRAPVMDGNEHATATSTSIE